MEENNKSSRINPLAIFVIVVFVIIVLGMIVYKGYLITESKNNSSESMDIMIEEHVVMVVAVEVGRYQYYVTLREASDPMTTYLLTRESAFLHALPYVGSTVEANLIYILCNDGETWKCVDLEVLSVVD